MSASSGDWPTIRHDARLSGCQPLPGGIRRPAVAWKYHLGGSVFDAEILWDGGESRLLLMYGGCIHCHTVDGSLVWKSRAQGFEGIAGIHDLDNDGRPEIVATNGKTLFVLDARTGAVLWQEYLGPPFAAGFMHTGTLIHHFPQIGEGMQVAVGLLSSREVVLYDFTPGASSPERLHILWMDDFFHPSILAVDVDGDGLDELIVTKYSAVYVFDPLTGNQKSLCRWSSGGTAKRNYGLFAARDLNGDDALDFVVLSNRVSKHIAVVENDGRGGLRNRWDRFLEHIYPVDAKDLRYTFHSCADIDGDGRSELIVSVYNDDGDGRWWLEIIDAWSGEVRLRHPELYLQGIHTMPGYARPLLFCSHAVDRRPSEHSTISAFEWDGAELRCRWAVDDASFVGRFLRTDSRTTLFRSELPPADEIWRVQIDGIPSIPLLCSGGNLALRTVDGEREWRTDMVPGVEDIVSLLAVDDLDLDGRTEMVVCTRTEGVRIVRADGHEVGRIRVGPRMRPGVGVYYMAKPMQTPTVQSIDGMGYCAVPDGEGAVRLLRWNSEAAAPFEALRVDGHGRFGPEEAFHGVPFAEWKGERVMLVSSLGDDKAQLSAVRVDGSIASRWEADGLLASPRVPPGRIGLYEFHLVGDGNRPLIVMSGYESSSMNSERTWVADAARGQTLWSGRVLGDGEDGRGFGPWNAATVIGSKSAPELLFLAKDTVCHIDLRTGRLLHEPWQLRPYNTVDLRRRGMSMDDFAAYGSLIPVDVDGDGVDEWVAGGVYGGVGVIGADHRMRWWLSAPLSSLTGGFPGIADVNGDGLPELGLSYADGDFVCLRADTGAETWRLHLGEVASDVVTCDVNGDGRPEFILATQQGSVMALGVSTSGCGLILWKLDLGYSLGPIVVADLNGDGRSEILVAAGDGSLYGIDQRH